MPTPEELEAERVASEAAAQAVTDEAARLAAEEAAKAGGKTPEELEAEAKAKTDAEALAAAEAAKPKPEPKADWRDERLAKVTGDKARLAERLAQYETPDGKPKATPEGDLLPKAEVTRLANEQAQVIASRTAFNQACNDAAAQGRKTWPDFDASVKALGQLVDREDPQSIATYDAFLAAALETGEPEKIIYQMGRDLDVANEVLKLGSSPVKQARRLAELASADAQQVSDLPKPIVPLKGSNPGPSEIAPSDPVRADKLSTEEWMKRREKEVAEKQPQNQRRRA